MTGRDDKGKPPFDDGDNWIDRDDDTASGPLIDRDDDEIFGADPPKSEPGFPEEREYPAVPEWDDDGSDPVSLPEWDAPSADNDDLNRLAARELDELGDDPYAIPTGEPLPPMSAGPAAGSATSSVGGRDFLDDDSDDDFDDGDHEYPEDPRVEQTVKDDRMTPGPLSENADAVAPRFGDSQEDWRDDSSMDSGDDTWSDESVPAAAPARDSGRAYSADNAAVREMSQTAPSEQTAARRWPIFMLAIAAVAVVLLAVGGYGMLSKRSALEDEIRQLQAQLATAVSPQEVRASRDAQLAIEQEKINLEAEVSALQSENTALRTTLRDMEVRLEEQAQEAEAAVAAAEAAASTAAASGGSGAAGNWFVNFGSYARIADARRWASRLEVDSGSVVVQDATSQGRTIHRVRVVGLADKATADRVASKLEAAHKLPKLWVGRN